MPPELSLTLQLTALGLAFFAGLSVLVSAIRLGIGPVPSSRAAQPVILQLVGYDVTGTIFELGAGWGGLALALARHCPNAKVVAVEASLIPALFCRLRFRFSGCDNVSLKRENFFETQLTGAQVVVCYLFRGAMKKLEPKFEHELPAGGRVISFTFALPSRKPAQLRHASDLYRSPVYAYEY